MYLLYIAHCPLSYLKNTLMCAHSMPSFDLTGIKKSIMLPTSKKMTKLNSWPQFLYT